ncbi:hypothetical protein ACIQW7_26075 [Peribacillus simplex]|nr:hypothetical protein [Peribacillus frigoritolerans]
MKILSKLSLILICAYFLIPASEDFMTWKPSFYFFDENGHVIDKLVDTP